MAGKVYEYIIVLKKRSFVFINTVSILMIAIAALLLSLQVILHGYERTIIYNHYAFHDCVDRDYAIKRKKRQTLTV